MTHKNMTSAKNSLIGRRLFLKSLVTLTALSCAPTIAQANNMLFAQSGRARWDDQFDAAPSAGARVASNQPVLSSATVEYTQRAIAQYEEIVSRGGWQRVPTEQGKLRIGVTHPAVIALRQRLAASGDLQSGIGMSQSFDTYVDAAVKRFQARHGQYTRRSNRSG